MKRTLHHATRLTLASALALLVLLMGCSKDDSAGDGPSATNSSGSGGTGQVGSMARFAISGSHLYVVNNNSLNVYGIDGAGGFTYITARQLNWTNAETLFPYDGHLFVGTSTGMMIYSLEDPTNPQHISTYQHIVACDPVVVQGDYAYVTLREAQECRRTVNRLDVVDVRNPSSPQLVSQMEMSNPHGLAVKGRQLVVCEGNFGLKSLSLDNPSRPALRQEFDAGNSYDVIAGAGSWIVTGSDGIRQYQLDGQDRFQELSRMPTVIE